MEEIDLGDENHIDSNKERFIKLIVGTAAGFIASRAAEHFVENVLANRRKTRL